MEGEGVVLNVLEMDYCSEPGCFLAQIVRISWWGAQRPELAMNTTSTFEREKECTPNSGRTLAVV